ncbi:hypothetical protein PVK62_07890 [Aliivibrio sp. S3MY1]|uniref:hypothetical protein n=1 Tax=unclassified Aliivibrio TaxID=2645654 RepID=UPI0023782509|nr:MULTISPECIES: hypothetical protein [unclassified Aliivibrio]MDD9176030.1 hypothetical protein [Aliivibrio sp. S3TY1]MDD9193056.1 hypothetical protein [Aliivibrio sp. S2TY2]MDD9195759.1 hypothetical protein [Aliivibrio sp. S3MY1]
MAENTAATIMKTGNYPAYSAAKEKGIIEEGIQPLCDALLEIGAHPLASCAGHYSGVITGRLGRIRSVIFGEQACWLKPYITFSSSTNLAQKLNGYLNKEKGLTFNWHISGQFNDKNHLIWMFEPVDWRISARSSWSHTGRENSERLVHRDIKIIAKKITQFT